MAITIVRVGAGELDMSLAAAETLKTSSKIVLHTRFCGCADWLTKNGLEFSSLDDVYENAYDFDEHAEIVRDRLLSYDIDVTYCVMELGDETVKYLLASDRKIAIVGAGKDDELIARSSEACLTVNAIDIENTNISSQYDTIVKEIDSRTLASDVKLKLMAHYPEESEIYVIQKTGVARCHLMDLDRLNQYDHTVSCLIKAEKNLMKLERYDFHNLMSLVRKLRDPVSGCPWDAEQTHDTLKRDTLEEAYELQDAIEKDDMNGMIEELGDVLFAAALHMQIGIEHGEFDELDVITGVVSKMISRHSHVFGKDQVDNIESLLNLWDKAKRKEKGLNDTKDEMLAVAMVLPALLRAQKVLKRAQKGGYQTMEAELGDLDYEAYGDMLLACAEWARRRGIDAEKALEDAVGRYIQRV